MDVVDYEIKGTEMQFVEVELDPGEAAVGEAGSLFFMDAGITMDTVFGDGSEPVGPTATVTFAEPTGPATLATKLIARYVISSETGLLSCYQREVLGAQTLPVTLLVSVDGHGSATAVSATGVSDAAATCMVDVIKATMGSGAA